MTGRRVLLALALVSVALLSGCASDAEASHGSETPVAGEQLTGEREGRGIYRIVDEEYGVVCYYTVRDYDEPDGLDCLPLSDVREPTPSEVDL